MLCYSTSSDTLYFIYEKARIEYSVVVVPVYFYIYPYPKYKQTTWFIHDGNLIYSYSGKFNNRVKREQATILHIPYE